MTEFRCPNKNHHLDEFNPHHNGAHHYTRAQVILCVHRKEEALKTIEEEFVEADEEAQARAEYEAEMAYERHLEDRGWAEHAAFADYERSMGIF